MVSGSLQVNFSYSSGRHRRSRIEGWARDYLEALKELIAHCQSKTAPEFTPSDFPLARLDAGKLQRIAGILDQSDEGGAS